MKKLLTLFLLAAFTGVQAQAPQGFNYQAVARDAGGVAITNKSIGVQVQLLRGSATGASVYTETHAVTSNNLGLLNLVVGNGTVVAGSFSGIDWSNGPYFIEIGMDVTGGTNYQLMGTQQLMSVPYALYAVKSGSQESNGTNTSLNLSGTDLNLTDAGGTLSVPLGNTFYPSSDLYTRAEVEKLIEESKWQYYFVEGTTDVACSGGPYELMPQMTSTFTLSSASTVLVQFSAAGGGRSANVTAAVRLLVDGVVVNGAGADVMTGVNSFWNLSIMKTLSLSPGTHTVSIEWACTGGPNAIENFPATKYYNHRSLNVTVIK